MNTITLTVELGPETQAKLDKILEALQHAPDCSNCCVDTAVKCITDKLQAAPAEAPAERHTEPQEDQAPAPVAETHPIEEEGPFPEPAPAEEPKKAEPEKPAVTLDQIRQKVTQLMAKGGDKKTGARDIVKSYAENISGLPEAKWPEIWDKLVALDKPEG